MHSLASLHWTIIPLDELELPMPEELEPEDMPEELEPEDMPEVELDELVFPPLDEEVEGSSPQPTAKMAKPATKPKRKPKRPRPKVLNAIRPPMNTRERTGIEPWAKDS